jgi:hypothetical protein
MGVVVSRIGPPTSFVPRGDLVQSHEFSRESLEKCYVDGIRHGLIPKIVGMKMVGGCEAWQ